MSSSRPIRRSGADAAIASPNASSVAAIIFDGNGPGATGAYREIPGITPDIGGQARDSKRVAEAAEGRALSSREVSAHFARQAWSWIAHEPAAALSLFLRKSRLLLSRDEVPLNFSFPWYREKSRALKLLAVGPGLLVPLAGAGP